MPNTHSPLPFALDDSDDCANEPALHVALVLDEQPDGEYVFRALKREQLDTLAAQLAVIPTAVLGGGDRWRLARVFQKLAEDIDDAGCVCHEIVIRFVSGEPGLGDLTVTAAAVLLDLMEKL